jgi:hypothetical protein
MPCDRTDPTLRFNELTIYQRTPDGQWAAYSPDSPLPRRLKILLKAIDGRVTEEVYAENLVAFGDVKEILKSLAQSGLIEDSSASAGPNSHHESSIVSESRHQSERAAEHQSAQSTFAYQALATQSLEIAEKQTDFAPQELNLRLAIEAMSNFVITYLPDAAFHVLQEIESLKSIDQLAAMLDGYSQFLIPAGEVRLAHIAQLHKLVKEQRPENSRSATHGEPST